MIDILKTRDQRASYNECLKALVSQKTVFSHDEGIVRVLRYCGDEIRRSLPDRNTWFDALGNLISVSREFDARRPAVFLSAHVDTVDADPVEWVSSPDPFQALETPTHIIGRGANDCKAGVAMILHLCRHHDQLPLDNVVFLLSYREEGNKAKTASAIGAEMGRGIPLSMERNLVVCLENTTRVSERICVQAYDREPCNAFIEMTDYPANIRQFLLDNPGWKPVCIRPAGERVERRDAGRVRSGLSGHIATIDNDQNVIYDAIMGSNPKAIVGGDAIQTSVLHNRVEVFSAPEPLKHAVVMNLRTFMPIAQLKRLLDGVSYREYFPFTHAAGSDRREGLEGSAARRVIMSSAKAEVDVECVANPGRSDASVIWNASDFKSRLSIYTMGPGSRSHLDRGVRRKTHGPDEGFHKPSGHAAIRFITGVVHAYLQSE